MSKFNLLCWTCNKEHKEKDVPLTPSGVGYKCECGGYVVSPSGKVKLKQVEHD